MLCKNPFEGGHGYLPKVVGEMTLDQIYMLLADPKNLRKRNEKVRDVEVLQGIGLLTDKEGKITGRAADGTVIKGQIKGKSLATRLREEAEARRKAEAEEQARKAAEEARKNRRRRRGR